MSEVLNAAGAGARDFPSYSALATHQSNPAALLDDAHRLFLSGDAFEAMSLLYVGLYGQRRSMARAEWLEFCKVCREHDIRHIINQSPLTSRALAKPRGYAGDAVMIDMIYRYGNLPDGTTPLGLEILEWEVQSPGGRGARNRRAFIASLIDFVATVRPTIRVLSIACGHLREVELSTAIREHRVSEFVGLDQDAESLREVTEKYSAWVTPVRGSVRQILKEPVAYHDFDLVYASGLYDYLPDEVAVSLLQKMWAMVRPGGRVLIANWVPDVLDLGYLESFMDWCLIYRDEQQMNVIADQIPAPEVLSRRLFRDPADACIFLELVRK